MKNLRHLTTLLAEAEAEARRLSAAREAIEEEHARAQERVDLFKRLIGLEGGTSGRGNPTAVREESAAARTAEPAPVEEHIERVLASSGKPMHIKRIREALVSAGVPLPGRGDEANIIVRLARAPERFVRTGRGTYGLKSWGVAEVRPTRKRRVSRSERP